MFRFAGHLRLAAEARPDGRTLLVDQSFRAPFHLSKPYWDEDARTLLVQVVNPTAGILSGDRLSSDISVAPQASLLVTTPSASRVFTMTGDLAECHQSFFVDRHGWLEFAPEPLVPHRGSRYLQTTRVELRPDAGLFYVDQLMPGRLGHGESWSWADLNLTLEVRLAGELILRERFAHSGPELRAMAEFAGSGATACFANAVLMTPSSVPASWAADLSSLHRDGVWLGATNLRQGGGTIKIVAADPIRLRHALRETRTRLSHYLPALRTEMRKL